MSNNTVSGALQTSNSQTNYSIKWSVIGFFSYLVITIVVSAVLSSVWMTNNDLVGLSPQQIGSLMNQDSQLVFYTSITGFLAAIFCAWLVTRKKQNYHYASSLILAVCLGIYGVVSITLHPEHHVIHQIGKVISPFLASALGVYLAKKTR